MSKNKTRISSFPLVPCSQRLYPISVTLCADPTSRQCFICRAKRLLKMLGLYLYTLIISHKSSNMLRILNKLALYKELQTFVTNNVF